MSWPGFEPGPPVWEASTLEKSHPDSLLIAIPNCYILARDSSLFLSTNNYQCWSTIDQWWKFIGLPLMSFLEKAALYWSFIPRTSCKFSSNDIQARLAEEISQTLLTNKKPRSLTKHTPPTCYALTARNIQPPSPPPPNLFRSYIPVDIQQRRLCIHCKKRLSIFPSPDGMSLTKFSMAGNN